MKTKIKQKRVYALIAILSLLLSVVPFNFEHIFSKNAKAQNREENLTGNIRWTPTDNPGEFRYDKYTINGSLTIEAGTHLKLKYGSEIDVNGDLFIEGNEGNPVIFEGERSGSQLSYAVSVENGSEVNIDHAIFQGGGGDNCYSSAPSILNQSFAAGDCIPRAALNVEAEEIFIKNSTFDHNYRAINYFNGGNDSYLENNIFHHNDDLALYSGQDDDLDARNNCWMRPSGPTRSDNPDGLGEKIIGNVNFSNWQECGTDHEPVLIIPGIGGSWNWDKMFDDWGISTWGFAPTDHTYESLVKSFENKGYQRGKDLLIVFYDWRKDNHESAEQFLSPIIEDLKKKSFDEKYDLVAHSMGGIVAMDYLQNHGNQIFDKIVLLGTPLGGSAKAYPIWEGGNIPSDWDVIKKYLFLLKVKHFEINKDDYDLIHEHIPSVKQLLPIYNYIIPEGESELIWYDEMHEYNQYLDDLFWNTYNLFGNNTLIIEGKDVPTSKTIDVEDYQGADQGKIWKDGQPVHDPLRKDETQGDGTVVNTNSAFDFVPSDPSHPLFSHVEKISGIKHGELPTAAIVKIHNFLFAEQPPHGDYSLPSENKLVFTFASPVDVKIIGPDDAYITKNQNSIGSNAYYYSDGQDDGAKIVEIDNPTSGDYKAELTGNGNGQYHMLTSRENGESHDENETQGQITNGQNLNYGIEIDGNTVKKVEILPTSPEQGGDNNPEDPKTPPADSPTQAAEQDSTAQLSKIQQLDALKNTVRNQYASGLIKKKGERNYLLSWLGNVRVLLKKLQLLKVESKQYKKIQSTLQRKIIQHCNRVIAHINKNSPKKIDPSAAETLIENLNELKNF